MDISSCSQIFKRDLLRVDFLRRLFMDMHEVLTDVAHLLLRIEKQIVSLKV